MRHWSFFFPLLAAAQLAAGFFLPMGSAFAAACAVALIATVIASVHHAEVVAHRVGEPFGTLVLALAITAIEAALIISIMLAGGKEATTLARDTIYATVMIICNGVVGLCLLVGGLRHREQSFRIEGAGPAYAALVTLATMVLILPAFTVSTPGPVYSRPQLVFVACASLALWCVFIFFQTVHHRDYFLPAANRSDEELHAAPPSIGTAWISFGLLLLSLVAVVGLAKLLSPVIETAVVAAGAPRAVVGITVALIVLLPETWAAIRAALANRLQTSMNLALGSGLASIGLTIPLVILASILLDMPLVLGVETISQVLLALTFITGTVALGSGRTNMMQGVVQLVIFATFLFLALVP
jgi:Ca2+:H+ antiporter